MDKTFLFYDIETTGLSKAFDQVVQFAAVRTDADLNEIERHEMLVRLSPDVVPNPHAILTHGIALNQLDYGLTEDKAIEKIHQLMNTPGTISLGYNTLGFDDEFLRFSFYRHLLPPYNHQYANQCGRMDLYPIATLYYLFHNNTINWPSVDGVPSLKLANLNAANQFVEGNAHNALVDVLATIELARRFKETTAMWDYALGYFDKEADTARLTKLSIAFTIQNQSFREGIYVDGCFGAEQNYQTYVLSLGRHHHYKNQTLWLRLDRHDFSQIKTDEFNHGVFVINKKPGESGFLLPNSTRFTKYIDKDKQELIDKNRAWLIANPELFLALTHHHREYTHPKITNLDDNAALYQNGFLLPHEIQLSAEFHNRDIDGKIALIDEFSNPTLRALAIRYIGRLQPEKLNNAHQQIYGRYLASINPQDDKHSPVDYRNKPRYTPQQALQEIKTLQKDQTLTASKQKLLDELHTYINNQFSLAELKGVK
ncbi:MAG: exonuclease domain-containing protein [Pseudomonadota bacterium]|nr:exonuclease domain-containing protein [Pseudomonadota bacterium]